jgi:hypothetical protein
MADEKNPPQSPAPSTPTVPQDRTPSTPETPITTKPTEGKDFNFGEGFDDRPGRLAKLED